MTDKINTMKAPKHGKRMASIYAKRERAKLYSADAAVKLVREGAKAKFDETIEIALNLGVDPRHSDQMVRGVCQLPKGSGKTVRIAVFCKEDKAQEAKDAGADIVGAEDLLAQIQDGKIDFDRVIATPDMMPLVGRVAKILGPKGLMPNPKVGTVTPDVAKAVSAAKGGAVEFRAEKAGIVHAVIGKASFSEADLSENLHAFVGAILNVRPSGVKGTYLKGIAITSTMGAGIKIDPSTLNT